MDHINEIAPDFVLGLLLPEDRRRVLSHIVECESCRHTVANERQLIKDVRSAVHRVSEHNNHHIRELMPALPNESRTVLGFSALRPVIVAFALILITLGGLMMELDKGGISGIQGTAMHSVATSTNTEAPTFTATATIDTLEETIDLNQGSSLVIPGSAAPRPEKTPKPVQSGS